MISRLSISSIGLKQALLVLRGQLEMGFAPDTAMPGQLRTTPSAGHCAAVALIIYELLGGDLVSTRIDNISHWFNRLDSEDGTLDIDITADQFGFQPVRIASAGELYADTRLRSQDELNEETRRRSLLLKGRIKQLLGLVADEEWRRLIAPSLER